MLLIIVFIITAQAWLPHVVFSIIPTIGNLHKLGNSLRLLSTKFFNVGFSSDAITECIDRPVNRNIFGNI
jgi:hypothetical protein